MFESTDLLLAETMWQKIVQVLTTPSLQLFLLLGSLVLVISLLLLTLTRLGHARPITKCVVLSVIAHVLLLGYAYGTKLIFRIPQTPDQEMIAVNLVEDQDFSPPEPPADNLVDEFDPSLIPEEASPLIRPADEVPFELERVVDLPDTANDESADSPPKFDVARGDQATDSIVETPDIYFQVQDNIDIEPLASDFQRLGDGENDTELESPSTELQDLQTDRPTELAEVEFDPQILAEAANDVLAEKAEQYQSELVVPDSNNPIVEDFSAGGNNGLQAFQVSARKQQFETRHRLGDGKPLPNSYALRFEPGRAKIAAEAGGSQKTEDAVVAALAWLASVQKSDGSWAAGEHGGGQESKVFGHDRGGCGSNADTGITALATLAFLGSGNTHLEGQYRANVQRALEYLIGQQSTSGDISGNAKLFARMYCHSMALFAISETYALTGDHRLKHPVSRGIEFTLSTQDPEGGGWRYQGGDSGDMSQFGWKVMALKSAELGGFDIDPIVKQRMQKFLSSCAKGEHGGLASYRPGEGPSTTMTAEALACKIYLDQNIEQPSLDESKSRMLAELPSLRRSNLYYWYYGTLAMRHVGGEAWEDWNAALQRVLLAKQKSAGPIAGSWDPDGVWGGYGGRIYSTALSAMCLEVYYRYQPGENLSSQPATAMFPGSESTPIR